MIVQTTRYVLVVKKMPSSHPLTVIRHVLEDRSFIGSHSPAWRHPSVAAQFCRGVDVAFLPLTLGFPTPVSQTVSGPFFFFCSWLPLLDL